MSQAKAQAKQPVNLINVKNWILDHAMIIIIVLLALYVQIQRPQFFGVASLVNIVNLTTARMTFLGISGNVTYIIKGAVILIACILDMRKYRTKK